MDVEDLTKRVVKTSKDYTVEFKLMVVEEIEQGHLSYIQAEKKYNIQGHSTALKWLRKHGKLNWHGVNHVRHSDTPQKKMRDMEKRIKELELEKEVLNKAIDVADEMLGINIRKKYYALSLELMKRQKAQK